MANKLYYLYRHIRLDKNEPFYIGIGTIYQEFPRSGSRYERAFSGKKRNIYWKNIVTKTNYEVEILLESDNREFIIQKEVEFIKLYGRKNIKTGTLANMTDGGEGALGTKTNKGRKCTEETKRKLSLANKGKEHKSLMIPVNKYDLKNTLIKTYPSILSTKKDGFDTKSVSKSCKNLTKAHKGYVFKYA